MIKNILNFIFRLFAPLFGKKIEPKEARKAKLRGDWVEYVKSFRIDQRVGRDKATAFELIMNGRKYFSAFN